MKPLEAYSIPISGLKLGIHQFDFQVDATFFEQFDDQLLEAGDVQVSLSVDRQSGMLVFDFQFQGAILIPCDRCLERFELPVEGQQQFLVKYSDQAYEEEEVIYILKDAPSLNIAPYIYEIITLSLPLQKMHPTDASGNSTCNPEVLKYLELEQHETEDIPEKENTNPIWEELKKFKP